MAAKHQFKWSIRNVLLHNQEGSFQTKATRKRTLTQAVEELAQGGYKLTHVQGLKRKHVTFLNEQWQEQKLSPATIKNRNSHLRWLCEKIGKANLMPSNDELGVAKRQYSTNKDKSSDFDLSSIQDQRLQAILQLEKHFGLRREEAMKFQPHFADHGSYIVLKPSWCKGGRGREVPISSGQARYWLDQCKAMTANINHSMIPIDKSYKDYMIYYANTLSRLGFHGHGLRHHYAQQRYLELTGWLPPNKGGLLRGQLTTEQRALDYKARQQVSMFLGHSRIAVTSIYLGK